MRRHFRRRTGDGTLAVLWSTNRTICTWAIGVAALALTAAGSVGCARSEPTIVRLSFDRSDSGDNADERTLRSIRRVGDLYTINYQGDYEVRLRWMRDYFLQHAGRRFGGSLCSLFTSPTRSGSVLYGRSFDWKGSGPVLGYYTPPGRLASFAFSRLDELHVNGLGDGPGTLSEEERQAALFLPYFATDGINEAGLAIGIAGAPLRRVNAVDQQEPMFVLLFIRRALDTCRTVEEVARLAETVTLYDRALDTISHVFLAADSDGRWLVIDYPDGALRLTRGSGTPQARTNHFLEGGPSSADTDTSFSRYDVLHRGLNGAELLASDEAAMGLLERVRHDTMWSVVYDLRAHRGLLAVRENYRTQYRFAFPSGKP